MADERRWRIYKQANSRLRGALALQPFVEGIEGPETGGWIEVVDAPAGSPSGEVEQLARDLVAAVFEWKSHNELEVRASRLRAALAGQDDDGTDHG